MTSFLSALGISGDSSSNYGLSDLTIREKAELSNLISREKKKVSNLTIREKAELSKKNSSYNTIDEKLISIWRLTPKEQELEAAKLLKEQRMSEVQKCIELAQQRARERRYYSDMNLAQFEERKRSNTCQPYAVPCFVSNGTTYYC